MAQPYMLSTEDNPWNPWTDYDEWWAWDEGAGYHSASLLARVVRTSDDLSDPDQEKAIDDGIDEIVNENLSGMHIRVFKPANAA